MIEPEDPGGAGDHPHHIAVADEQDVRLDIARLTHLASHALAQLGMPDDAELSIVLADAGRMADLKGEWLGEKKPTDVLAFPMDGPELPSNGPAVLGDVVLCPEVARAQASDAGRAFDDEIALLLVHGILHLLGHDHAEPEEKARMWAEQDRVLASFAEVTR
jgi:probable rRNA maturation factor